MESPFTRLDYKSLANSEEGSAFLEKFLHPPGNPIGSLRGIPDRNCIPSTVVEFRDDITINPPTMGSAETWDCAILVLPIPDIPFLVWTTPTGATTPASSQQYNLPILSTSDAHIDYAPSKPILTQYASAFRGIGKSLTVRLDAPALADQGRAYAAQFEPEVNRSPLRDGVQAIFPDYKLVTPYDTIGTGQYYRYQFRGLSGIPFDGSGLAQISCSSVQHEARDGVFMPLRYSNPVLDYIPTFMESDMYEADSKDHTKDISLYPFQLFTVSGYGTLYASNRNSGLQNMSLVQTVPSPNNQGVISPALAPDNFAAGWIVFSGLSKQAKLSVRIVEIMECLTRFNSPWSPFSTPSALPDAHAVDSAYAVRQTMLDAYPACCNDFGSFFSGIKKIAPKLLDLATSNVGKAALGMVPGGGVMNTVLGAVHDIMDKGESKIQMPPQMGGMRIKVKSGKKKEKEKVSKKKSKQKRD